MAGTDWSRGEVEVIVDDYLSMLALELSGASYSKAHHRRQLKTRLNDRSEQSIEFKHCNISAALVDAGFPYINGYKPRSNYQALLTDVISERLSLSPQLFEVAAADADRPMVVPEVADILSILTSPPRQSSDTGRRAETLPPIRLTTNYIEREANNRSLGHAGELFAIQFEQERLIRAGRENLASRIEHTSKVRGDHEGYDILSFDETGAERLIEVKTTKYGAATPFFVSRNEVAVSELQAPRYHVYRLHSFSVSPRMYMLPGAIARTCNITAATYLALPK